MKKFKPFYKAIVNVFLCVLIPACIVSAAAPSMLDDMDDNNNQNNWGGIWFTYDDLPLTGNSYVWPMSDQWATAHSLAVQYFSMSAPGYGGTGYAARMTGYVSAAYTYGFIGMGCHLLEPKAPVDLSACTGMRFWIKGDSKSYRVKIISLNSLFTLGEGDNHYEYNFVAPTSWSQMDLPFSSFTQECGGCWGSVVAKNLALQQAGGVYFQTVVDPLAGVDLWIDNLEIYGCPSYPPALTATVTRTGTATATATPSNTPSAPVLSIVKSSNKTTGIVTGDMLTFTLHLCNAGAGISAGNMTLTDDYSASPDAWQYNGPYYIGNPAAGISSISASNAGMITTYTVNFQAPGFSGCVDVPMYIQMTSLSSGLNWSNTGRMENWNGTPAIVSTVNLQDATRTVTRTSTNTRTRTPTGTCTVTPTYTPTFTYTLTSTFTVTPTATDTPSPSDTFTGTVTLTHTYTRTATRTFTVTLTATATFTITPTYEVTIFKSCDDVNDGNGAWSGINAARTQSANPAALTQPPGCLKVNINTTASWNDQILNCSGFYPDTFGNVERLTMDVYVDPAAIPWMPSSTRHELNFYVNGTHALAQPVALASGMNHVTFYIDYNLSGIQPGDILNEFLLIFDSDGSNLKTGTIYVDNMRLWLKAPVTPTMTKTPDISLADAVDNFTLLWYTGGAADWSAQTVNYMNLGDAAQSGAIGDNQTSILQTFVGGTGTIKFYWKVDSDPGDAMNFYIDGVEQATISGNIDWRQESFDVGLGTHLLEWKYEKNGDGITAGADSGWVDKVEYFLTTPTITPTGTITATMTVSPSPTLTYTPQPWVSQSPTCTPVEPPVNGSFAYPQPALNYVTFAYCLESPAQVKIYVYNFSGHLAWAVTDTYTSGTNRKYCSISGVPPGVYYYVIEETRGGKKKLQKPVGFMVAR